MSWYGKILSRRGVLLIEILLSMVILSVSLTLIMQSLLSNLHAIAGAIDYARNTLAFESKLDLVFMQSLRHDPIHDGELADSSGEYQFFLKQHPVQASNNSTAMRLNEAELTMSWKNGKKENHISTVTFLPDFSHEK